MEVNPEEREDFKRKSRNLSEKKRRDQFNVLVTELGNMITSWGSSPSSNSGRKMDKTTVLKSTISFLKKHKQQQLLAQQQQQQGSCGGDAPPSPPGKLEAIQGFILVFGTDGKIIYVSESISSLLGYAPLQITERSVYEFIGNDGDKLLLYNTLLEIFVHFKRADGHDLELARIWGTSGPGPGFPCPNALQENTNLTPYDPFFRNESEFTSRYSLEWKFLFLDGRAPPIIGYLPFELLGTSGYDYYHTEDLERVSVCHEALMQTGEVTNCLHRFLTKGQQWIWLQTRYYITYHQWNSKPEFIVATHKVVNYSDVVKQVKKEGCDPNKIEPLPPSSSPALHHSVDPYSEAMELDLQLALG
ncbi:Clock [Caligus rogercresseyi]|uniref:Clock n=1 Tax=Caligus rogercresseyi TaxID=217165 RepID=A0A7T8KJ22_CALRO|nr:Clock [Caligus rogercresseyi]